jgi:hypothetical protein
MAKGSFDFAAKHLDQVVDVLLHQLFKLAAQGSISVSQQQLVEFGLEAVDDRLRIGAQLRR